MRVVPLGAGVLAGGAVALLVLGYLLINEELDAAAVLDVAARLEMACESPINRHVHAGQHGGERKSHGSSFDERNHPWVLPGPYLMSGGRQKSKP
jgi:hypothetical protein